MHTQLQNQTFLTGGLDYGIANADGTDTFRGTDLRLANTRVHASESPDEICEQLQAFWSGWIVLPGVQPGNRRRARLLLHPGQVHLIAPHSSAPFTYLRLRAGNTYYTLWTHLSVDDVARAFEAGEHQERDFDGLIEFQTSTKCGPAYNSDHFALTPQEAARQHAAYVAMVLGSQRDERDAYTGEIVVHVETATSRDGAEFPAADYVFQNPETLEVEEPA